MCIFHCTKVLGEGKECFKKELLDKTRGFDTVILIRYFSFWGEQLEFSGYGVKNKKWFKLKIALNEDSARSLTFKSID